MAFTYSAGLRIRPPDPMPDCVAGETPQDYFARVLAECSLESSTTAENASGDSAATPFNIGQVQSDLAQALEAIETLGTELGTIQVSITALEDGEVNGIATFALGATTVVISFPSDGNWRVTGIVALDQALASVFVSDVTINTAIIHFGAAAAAGSLNWCAYKVP